MIVHAKQLLATMKDFASTFDNNFRATVLKTATVLWSKEDRTMPSQAIDVYKLCVKLIKRSCLLGADPRGTVSLHLLGDGSKIELTSFQLEVLRTASGRVNEMLSGDANLKDIKLNMNKQTFELIYSKIKNPEYDVLLPVNDFELLDIVEELEIHCLRKYILNTLKQFALKSTPAQFKEILNLCKTCMDRPNMPKEYRDVILFSLVTILLYRGGFTKLLKHLDLEGVNQLIPGVTFRKAGFNPADPAKETFIETVDIIINDQYRYLRDILFAFNCIYKGHYADVSHFIDRAFIQHKDALPILYLNAWVKICQQKYSEAENLILANPQCKHYSQFWCLLGDAYRMAQNGDPLESYQTAVILNREDIDAIAVHAGYTSTLTGGSLNQIEMGCNIALNIDEDHEIALLASASFSVKPPRKYSVSFDLIPSAFDNRASNLRLRNGLDHVNKLLTKFPDSPQFLLLRGKIYSELNYVAEAIINFNKCVNDPKYGVEAIRERGWVQVKRGNLSHGFEDLMTAYNSSPNDTLGLAKLGVCLRKMGKYHESVKCLEQLSSSKTIDACNLHVEYAEIYRLSGNFPLADEYLHMLSGPSSYIHPDFISLRKAMILRSKGQFDPAQEMLSNCTSLFYQNERDLESFYYHFEKGEQRQAVKLINSVLEEDPDNLLYLCLKAKATMMLGSTPSIKKARIIFEEILAEDPNHVEALAGAKKCDDMLMDIG